ncbi:acetyl-CoA synthetase-like protein [Ramicandelaber brevisporus]|nr:acetyl-CoA synthetase-like protein [Ramicandelaber brevisporus]
MSRKGITIPSELSYEAAPATSDKHGPARRNYLCRIDPATGAQNLNSAGTLATTPDPAISTLYDVLKWTVNYYDADLPVMGGRPLVDIVSEEKTIKKPGPNGTTVETKKKWSYFHLGDFEWWTYKDVDRITRNMGAALRKIGLNPGDRIMIFAPTAREWISTAMSCYTQSIVISTAYDTLGEEGLITAIEECEITTVLTTAELLPMIERVKSKLPQLKNVIFFCHNTSPNKGDAGVIEKLKGEHDMSVYTFDEALEMGSQCLDQFPEVPPKADDIACVMWTSGSSGKPKGVLIRHRNVVAAIAGTTILVRDYLNVKLQHGGKDREATLCYLPTAHILECTVEHAVFYWGFQMGYGHPRTLTDLSVRNCVGDMKALAPTILVGVPQVWDTIRKGVNAKLQSASTVARTVFSAAMGLKWWLMQRNLPNNWIDGVFAQIKEATGGRLKYALSGGAPLSQESQRFLSSSVCLILQGYGLTETCGMGTILFPEGYALGCAGAPVPCQEIKLVSVEEAGYKVTNQPRPQGEVWLRGGAVNDAGYFKRPDLTAEAFTEDGWFMTGDIGEWTEDGQLVIIDRKKNLVKLSNGEYIALEKLESTYKGSIYVNNICVYADSFRAKAVGVITPIESAVMKFVSQNPQHFGGDASGVHYEDACVHPAVKAEVMASLADIAKRSKFVAAEILQDVHLTHEEWTPNNDMLTAAQKLNRRVVVNHYKSAIDTLYANSN